MISNPYHTATMAATACSTWVPLPLKPASTLSQAEHDRAAREILRHHPEAFSDGLLKGMRPKMLTWEDLYSETEIAIIKEGLSIDRFNDFLAVMVELFPPREEATEKMKHSHRKKLLLKAISLWHQVCDLRGE